MLALLAHALPQLGVDRARCGAAQAGGALATDEVMRRVEAGLPFRTAYREVAAAIKAGETFPPPSPAEIAARRSSTGNLGNLGLSAFRDRIRRAASWGRRERRRFDRAMHRLAGGSRPPARPT
jgi:hypothetical protein